MKPQLTVTITGREGAGKSTLARLLAPLLEASGYCVSFVDEDEPARPVMVGDAVGDRPRINLRCQTVAERAVTPPMPPAAPPGSPLDSASRKPNNGETLRDYRTRVGLPGASLPPRAHWLEGPDDKGGWLLTRPGTPPVGATGPVGDVPPVPPSRRASDEPWPLLSPAAQQAVDAVARQVADVAYCSAAPEGTPAAAPEAAPTPMTASALEHATGYTTLAAWLEAAIPRINHAKAWTDPNLVRACVAELRRVQQLEHYIGRLEATLLDYQHVLEGVRSVDCGHCNSDQFARAILKQPTHRGLVKAIVPTPERST